MGFLDRLRASQSTQQEGWDILSDVSQLKKIDELSKEKPVILFKHSTTCGISASAKHRIEMDWSDLEGDFAFYYLDLLRLRPISKAIADRYGVRHESPQVLVIKNGKATYHTSHHGIQISSINKAIS